MVIGLIGVVLLVRFINSGGSLSFRLFLYEFWWLYLLLWLDLFGYVDFAGCLLVCLLLTVDLLGGLGWLTSLWCCFVHMVIVVCVLIGLLVCKCLLGWGFGRLFWLCWLLLRGCLCFV